MSLDNFALWHTYIVGEVAPTKFYLKIRPCIFTLMLRKAVVMILNPIPNFPLSSTHLFCALGHSFPIYSALSVTRFPFILRSRSLVSHLFPYAPLGPPPNHLTSYLMDHLTIPQSTITCHHSAVRSTPQHHHLTLYGLPAHDALFLDRQLMMELYLELPRHDAPY